jgi:hypothetical protein
LRDHWESEKLIPLQKEDTNPDWQFCLLEQKISMLNCCIQESIKTSTLEKNEEMNLSSLDGWNFLDIESTEKKEEKEEEEFSDHIIVSDESEASDNEFFDVDEEKEEDFTNRRGVLKRFSNHFLHNGLKMYIPITQTFPPYTEGKESMNLILDMISLQQKVFENLGTSEEATIIRSQSISC